MIGAFVASLLVFAVGAILDFAVTASPNQHGFNINTVGVIMMIVGVVGMVATGIAALMAGRHTIDSQAIDSRGNAAEFHQEVR